MIFIILTVERNKCGDHPKGDELKAQIDIFLVAAVSFLANNINALLIVESFL